VPKSNLERALERDNDDQHFEPVRAREGPNPGHAMNVLRFP
jgi:hypothetical protein